MSSFAFVEAAGPIYAGKLLRDALGLGPSHLPQDPVPQLSPGLDAAQKLASAEMVLRAVSMTDGFARVVLLAGHGANVTNNPHASALHCGACGGYSGKVNARLLAALLNDPEVRHGLRARGMTIPDDTLFVAGLHDTTTDEVLVYSGDHPSAVTVRPDCPAALIEGEIVSVSDSGHYGVAGGASDKAALDG